jgi:hypothetical protein
VPPATKPLAAKLGLRAGQSVLVLNPDGAVLRQLKRTARGVRWLRRWPRGHADQILVWFQARDDVRACFRRFLCRLKPDGAVWAVVAKASVKGADSPSWDAMVKAALASGVWVDIKICSVSARDYATRFVIRKDKRARLSAI